MKERWDKDNLEKCILISYTKLETLKQLGLKQYTGNYDTLNKYIKLYDIDISHFKFDHNIKNLIRVEKIPTDDILVEGSTYNRTHLKERLYKEGLKERKCERCGQSEEWNGEKMSLILDHINGVNNDNRIENLRIVCPNCNATLPTHCGKNRKENSSTVYEYNGKLCECGKRLQKRNKSGKCKVCYDKSKKIIKYSDNTNCEMCDNLIDRRNKSGLCSSCYNIHISHRKVKERPPYDQLIKEIKELGYKGTGRKYGVSDNSIRKWKNKYEK